MEIKMTDDADVVTLNQIEKFQFKVHFGGSNTELITDEPEPIGTGKGPSPDQLLAASVANCMSDSLSFALTKFKEDPSPIKTKAKAVVQRNSENRLRIAYIDVEIRLGKPIKSALYMERALAQFESFCTVASSVGQSLPIKVKVFDSEGNLIKG